jgi:hypothetical protein
MFELITYFIVIAQILFNHREILEASSRIKGLITKQSHLSYVTDGCVSIEALVVATRRSGAMVMGQI